MVIFEVAKVYSRQLFEQKHTFPESSADVVFAQNHNFPSKFVCIAKIKFMMDIYGNETNSTIYETRIFDNSGYSVDILSPNVVSENLIIELPVDHADRKNVKLSSSYF
jgi:hypothetical protein